MTPSPHIDTDGIGYCHRECPACKHPGPPIGLQAGSPRLTCEIDGTRAHIGRPCAPEIIRMRELTTWRPMESAPRDGTWILIAKKESNPGQEIDVAMYCRSCADRSPHWITHEHCPVAEDLIGWLPLPPGPKT